MTRPATKTRSTAPVPVAKLRRLKPPPVKLVAIDLDGTLLDSTKRVGDATLDAVHEAMARGVKIVIASARPPRSVRAIYQRLGLDTLQINYNGAMVWNETDRSVLFHQPIRAELVRQMIEFARDAFEDVSVSCEVLDRWITDRAEQPFTTETGKLFPPDAVVPSCELCATDVTKLLMLGDETMLNALEPQMSKRFGMEVTVLHTDRDLLQLMDRRVSKGITLQRVAGFYGVQMQNVLAIGDAPNDVGMLQLAGLSVAMDNAHPLVKKVADWVAPSNDDHGVCAAIRRYVLA